jgi:putative peptide zinc metalloprotease protein
MRYDGYYILADLVEVPNLASKSSAAVKRFLTRIVLGIEPPDDPFLPRRHQTAFAVYAVASTVYRWVVVFSILWFLYEWLKPYRLEVIAQALACVMLVTFVVTPIVNFIRYFRVPGRSAQVKKPRVRIALAVAAAVLVAAALVPVPHRVFAALELEPRDPQNVYVNVPGALAEVLVQPGQHVETGTVLARLENVDLDLDIADLTTKRDRYRSQLESLRHRRFKDPIAGMQIPEVAKTLAAFDEQLAEKERDRERLTLVADRPGTALPAPEQSEPPTQPGELATWSGSPFEPRNRGCYLEKSTLVCHVGDPERYDALVVIDQSDVQQVRLGQEVEIKLDEFPERVFRGRIEEIARMDLKISPRHLSNKSGGELSTKTDASGVERPMAVSYQVRVPIDAPAGVLRSGFRGRAKIFTPWQPAAAQAWRWFCQTFHFKF